MKYISKFHFKSNLNAILFNISAKNVCHSEIKYATSHRQYTDVIINMFNIGFQAYDRPCVEFHNFKSGLK